MRKNWLLKLVFAVIIAFLVPNQSLADSRPKVSDIQNHWAEKEIEEFINRDFTAVSKGFREPGDFYLHIDEEGRFRPDTPLTRAEFILLFWHDRGVPLIDSNDFHDVKDHWVYQKSYLQRSVDSGLIVPDDYWGRRFDPDRLITRLEGVIINLRFIASAMGPPPTTEDYLTDTAAAIQRERLLRLLSETEEPRPFVDMDAIPSWAHPYVATASRIGLVKGRADGLFAWDQTLTRAEAVVLMTRSTAIGVEYYSRCREENGKMIC